MQIFLKHYRLLLLCAILLTGIASLCVIGCSEITRDTADNYFTVRYIVSEGGIIELGDETQTIKQGEDGALVSVTPYEGYAFVEWSDGLQLTTRQEKNVQADTTLEAIFSKATVSIKYKSTYGGNIIGESEQSVKYGDDASSVMAVPNEDYLFAGWGDGNYNQTRQDKHIKDNAEIEAKFVSKTKNLFYEYNNATSNKSIKNIILNYNGLDKVSFVVPQKKDYVFGGWYLESTYNTKVADENGKLFLGNGIFFLESDTIYAKWLSDDVRLNTFKILMIFIDEVDATLQTSAGISVGANYRMSLIERKICELIPLQIFQYLNECFDGSINFEIDVYFTTDSLGDEAFDSSMSSSGKRVYSPTVTKVPEIASLLKNYRSVTTTFCLNDYSNDLHGSAGSATEKYATINLETILKPLIINDIPLESYLDLSYANWETVLEVYIHEYIHTIEMGLDIYEYHEVQKHYWNKISVLDTARLYLLNQAIVNDLIVGIPSQFWSGEIDVLVHYEPSNYGGSDNGNIVVVGCNDSKRTNAVHMRVPFGSELTVKAIPFNGYVFSHWSDGVTSAIRQDTDIISYLNVTAIFVSV